MTKKKTPGKAPGIDLDGIKRSVSPSPTETPADQPIESTEDAKGLLNAVAREIEAEKENEELTTLSARVPKDVARRIKREALAHDLKVGVYLRKILAHTFPPLST
ncbi:MAG: hypothetical protein AB8G05_27370 [Oligoflexales bacterium]